MLCETCNDDGVIWDENGDDDDDERNETKAKSWRLYVDRSPAATAEKQPNA